jgi:hypothetical protein
MGKISIPIPQCISDRRVICPDTGEYTERQHVDYRVTYQLLGNPATLGDESYAKEQ